MMEQLGDISDARSGTFIFRQEHPWSLRHGPTTLLHVTVHTRASYSHIRLPEKILRWAGDEMEISGITKYGTLTFYSQYSKHLDGVNVEDREVDFDEKEFDLARMTFTYRINHNTFKLNKKPYLALRPDYLDRSKRVIFL